MPPAEPTRTMRFVLCVFMVRMIIAINSYYFYVGFYNAFCKAGTGLSYITVMDRGLAVLTL